MNRANWHKHVRIATTFGVAVFILVLAAREYRGQWSSDVEFSSVLKSWPERLVPAKDPEQLTASLKALQDELDHDGDASGDEPADDGRHRLGRATSRRRHRQPAGPARPRVPSA